MNRPMSLAMLGWVGCISAVFVLMSANAEEKVVQEKSKERYRKDVPKAEVHVLDAGHFALDTKADEIATLVRVFIK